MELSEQLLDGLESALVSSITLCGRPTMNTGQPSIHLHNCR